MDLSDTARLLQNKGLLAVKIPRATVSGCQHTARKGLKARKILFEQRCFGPLRATPWLAPKNSGGFPFAAAGLSFVSPQQKDSVGEDPP